MKNWASVFVFLLTVSVSFSQSFSTMVGSDKFFPTITNNIIQINKSIYSINYRVTLDNNLIGYTITKQDANGKVIFCLATDSSVAGIFQFWTLNNKLFITDSKLIAPNTYQSRILSLDTNGNIIKTVQPIDIGTFRYLSNNKMIGEYSIGTSVTGRIYNITIMNDDLEVVRSVNMKDSLGLKIRYKVPHLQGKNLITSFTDQTSESDLFPNTYICKIDTNFNSGEVFELQKLKNFFPENGLKIDNNWSVFKNRPSKLYGDTVSFFTYNHLNDSVIYKKISIRKNPTIDTIPAFKWAWTINNTSNGDIQATIIAEINVGIGIAPSTNLFFAKLKPLEDKVSIFRMKKPEIFYGGEFNEREKLSLTSPNHFSFIAQTFRKIKNFNFRGFAINQDLSDPANCFTTKDSATIKTVGRQKLKRVSRLYFIDTTLQGVVSIPNPSFSPLPICAMDFCNPLSYGGLGPDVATCQDSMLLAGKVVYPGQKLVWNTGDTSLKVKVKVPGKYRITISGICGTFEDSISLSKTAPIPIQFTQEGPIVTCKNVLLIPESTQWINPTWITPKGSISGTISLLADTTGSYIIENGNENCRIQDTIFVDLRPIIKVNLNLGDSLFSCKDILLEPKASEWKNPTWQTPNGFFAGDTTVLASLTGKYTVQNNVLGCASKDSVYVVRRNPFVIILTNTEDTILTCKSVRLTAFSSNFLGTIWNTPNGIFKGISTLIANKTGSYKITNDIGNCINSDSVLIQFNDTSLVDFEISEGDQLLSNLELVRSEAEFPIQINTITQENAAIFRWYLNDVLIPDNSSKQNFTIGNEGNFTIRLITIKSDSCLGKGQKLLSTKKQVLPELDIPNLVTKNEDGKNDLFEILALRSYPDNEIHIFNRWGKEVLNEKPYKNDWPAADIVPGTYFYDLKAGSQRYNGYVLVFK